MSVPATAFNDDATALIHPAAGPTGSKALLSAVGSATARAAAQDGPSSAAAREFVVRPAPRREPLFDDEVAERRLTLVGPFDRPLPFETDCLVGPSALRFPKSSDTFGPQPTRRIELPELATFSRRLVIGIIEVAAGRRSAGQLAQHTAPAVQAGLARDAGRISRLGSVQRPASLHSVHISEPADGVAEVAAIVRSGDRFRAIALRLEGLDGRWRCVRLQIG